MTESFSQIYGIAYKQGGIQGLSSALDTHFNAWKTFEINIAVTGQSGSGKSSFINALRDLNADDEGAAKVGPVETTEEPAPFYHPNNNKFIVWDLPGAGTKNFSNDTYLEKIKVDRYDFFILISCKRTTENDIRLATEIEKRGRRFYFVRSQFANDISNKKKLNKKKKDYTEEEDVIFIDELYTEVYEYCQNLLQDLESRNNIFIIDSYSTDRFDFQMLKTKMISDSVKKETMIFTLTAATKDAIMEKKNMLEKRIWHKALRAALTPGVHNADVKLLLEEQEFYRNQLRLTTETLEQDCKTSQIEERLAVIMQEKDRADKELLKSKWLREIKDLVPFFPPIANQIKAFGCSKQWLTEALDSAVEKALELQKEMASGMIEARNDKNKNYIV